MVDSQGSVLGVWVSPADVSDARGARVVLEQVLRRYPSAQIVIADGAYDTNRGDTVYKNKRN